MRMISICKTLLVSIPSTYVETTFRATVLLNPSSEYKKYDGTYRELTK